MSLLGNIWVKLGLKADDFNSGVNNAEKRAERFGSFLGKISARIVLGWAAISAAVVKFARLSVQNYQQQEKANIKLQNALQKTGSEIGANYKDLQEYASQLQKVNGYADDATMDAMATLTTFRSVQGQVFKDTIAAGQDMAAFLGIDLNSAILQLGKALESPKTGITMLRRSGVIFTDEMTKNIKRLTDEGKTYEAQMMILGEVNKRFGGEAARQADTAAGAWKRVGMAFGDLTEHIGSASNASKGLAVGLAQALEYADKIISSESLSGWQKFFALIGIGRENAEKAMQAEDEERKKQAQLIQRHVDSVMSGIKDEAQAREKLAKQEAMYNEAVAHGWTQRASEAKAAIGALNGYLQQKNAEKAANEEAAAAARKAAAEAAKAEKEWKERHTGKVNELKDEIAAKETLRNMASDETEVKRLNQEIGRLKEKLALLTKINEQEALPQGSSLGKWINPKKEDTKKIDRDTLRQSWNEIIAANEDAIAKLEKQRLVAEDISEGFANALRSGIISGINELSEAIGTGDWDTSALVKAIVTPLADAAISAGVLIMTTGEGLEALRNAFETWFSAAGPYAAILAGGALVGLGYAAKQGIAAIASGSKSSSGGGSYSYTGGYGVAPQATNIGRMDISVTGVLKGQDIYLSGENYKKGLTR